jgi:hypothetical protein
MQNSAQAPDNRLCPVCGMPIDEDLQPVVAIVTTADGDSIVRVGACSHDHTCIIAERPERYGEAALANTVASDSFVDG